MKHGIQLPNVEYIHTYNAITTDIFEVFEIQTCILFSGLIIIFNGFFTPHSNKLVQLKTLINWKN
jgi:hypothetical protein